MFRKITLIAALLTLFVLVACQPAAEEPIVITVPGLDVPAVEPEPEVAILEPTLAAVATIPIATIPASVDGQPTAAPAPIITVTEPTPVPTALPAPTAAPPLYKVIDVAFDDTLNVRSGPGIAYDITAALLPTQMGIQITGAGEQIGNSLWVPIVAGDVRGWVNGTFLAQMSVAESFCFTPEVGSLVEKLQAAVQARDGVALAELVHPEGMTVGLNWWNPQIPLTPAEVVGIFNSTAAYGWGTQDGSGFDLTGTFAERVLPDLDKNLLPASQMGCNTILNGPTTGLVQLPPNYTEPFFALYRPAPPEGFEFDWGTWVVGIEIVNGRPLIRYLVQFDYEI